MGQSYRRGSICPPWPQHSPDVTHAGGQGGSPSPGDCSSCCSQSNDPPQHRLWPAGTMEVIPPASPWLLTPTTEDVASLSFPVSFSAWREGTALRQMRFQMAREHRARLEGLCQSISLHTRP